MPESTQSTTVHSRYKKPPQDRPEVSYNKRFHIALNTSNVLLKKNEVSYIATYFPIQILAGPEHGFLYQGVSYNDKTNRLRTDQVQANEVPLGVSIN